LTGFRYIYENTSQLDGSHQQWSVNRVLGMLWVAARFAEGAPAPDRLEDLRWVFSELLHVELADDALRELMR
jgi:hypothetical protein